MGRTENENASTSEISFFNQDALKSIDVIWMGDIILSMVPNE